ncbi:DUF805 domain-containing protein [Arthrobacter sp. Y-9]|uniref:DUF805 domain-containing protein n=1 Tax=Arthrobacter sp. Y-9 TaxID=3039385 RepID=UPI00241E33AA|nr:DUF805 domain-containing protein [Arthrobacter sp. Y-9]WFR83174.1 DUF805 domain-containing protein [Arthrobacter sp. Y-9]
MSQPPNHPGDTPSASGAQPPQPGTQPVQPGTGAPVPPETAPGYSQQYPQQHPQAYPQQHPQGGPAWQAPAWPAPGWGQPVPFVPRPRVGFVDAIKSGFRNYATFNGRAVNSEFWWWFVFEYLVLGILGYVAYFFLFAGIMTSLGGALSTSSRRGYRSPETDFIWSAPLVAGIVLGILFVIVALALLIPGLALRVRRLHDAGYSGWFVLLSLVPFGSVVVLALLAMESSPEGMKYGY